VHSCTRRNMRARAHTHAHTHTTRVYARFATRYPVDLVRGKMVRLCRVPRLRSAEAGTISRGSATPSMPGLDRSIIPISSWISLTHFPATISSGMPRVPATSPAPLRAAATPGRHVRSWNGRQSANDGVERAHLAIVHRIPLPALALLIAQQTRTVERRDLVRDRGCWSGHDQRTMCNARARARALSFALSLSPSPLPLLLPRMLCVRSKTRRGSRARSRRHASTASTRPVLPLVEAARPPAVQPATQYTERRCRAPGRTRGSPSVGERSSPKICEDPRFDTLGGRATSAPKDTMDHRDYLSDQRHYHYREREGERGGRKERERRKREIPRLCRMYSFAPGSLPIRNTRSLFLSLSLSFSSESRSTGSPTYPKETEKSRMVHFDVVPRTRADTKLTIPLNSYSRGLQRPCNTTVTGR